MITITKEQLIEDLKASEQNASGMFEIGEDTICALMSMLTSAAPQLPQPAVVDADDNFYSWFCREWDQYYQPNQYSTSARQHLGAIAESAWFACRAAMLQGADGALTNEDTKRVDELVMWIKRLSHSLRKARPDSKLQSDAMDYLSRKGLIGVEDILR